MKTITIIIATYNAERTLDRCLQSIVPQLTDECELILIDGNSKDGTNKIIDSYRNNISYTISEADKGIYDAWNKGIRIAQGKWIAFIGADDILLPNAINTYLDCIHNTPNIDSYDYICAHNEYVDMNGKILKILGKAPKWSAMKKMMPAAHVASLHHKHNLFEATGGYNLDYKICADYEMLIRKKNKFKYLMLDAHIARMIVGGMSFSTKAIKEVYSIRKKHHSVSTIMNVILFMRDWIAYELFKLRKLIEGAKLE